MKWPKLSSCSPKTELLEQFIRFEIVLVVERCPLTKFLAKTYVQCAFPQSVSPDLFWQMLHVTRYPSEEISLRTGADDASKPAGLWQIYFSKQ